MTDPDSDKQKRRDRLEGVLAALRKEADALSLLSFGDAASEVYGAVARIEHHTKRDTWTRLARATTNYMTQRVKNLPTPHVSVSYGGRGGETDSLHVQFHIKLESTVQGFIDQFDTEHDA